MFVYIFGFLVSDMIDSIASSFYNVKDSDEGIKLVFMLNPFLFYYWT